MLECILIAGTIFLSNGSDDGKIYNFHHATYLTLGRGPSLWADFGSYSRTFFLPDHMHDLRLDEVLNTCVAEAEYKATLEAHTPRPNAVPQE